MDQDEEDHDPGGGDGEREWCDETAHRTNLPVVVRRGDKRTRHVAAGTPVPVVAAHTTAPGPGKAGGPVGEGREDVSGQTR